MSAVEISQIVFLVVVFGVGVIGFFIVATKKD